MMVAMAAAVDMVAALKGVVEDSVAETVAALDKHLLRGAKTMAMEAALMVATAVVAKEATAEDLEVDKVAGEANKAEVVVEAAVAQTIPGTKEEDKAALAAATPGTMVQVVKEVGEVTLAGAMVATVVVVVPV